MYSGSINFDQLPVIGGKLINRIKNFHYFHTRKGHKPNSKGWKLYPLIRISYWMCGELIFQVESWSEKSCHWRLVSAPQKIAPSTEGKGVPYQICCEKKSLKDKVHHGMDCLEFFILPATSMDGILTYIHEIHKHQSNGLIYHTWILWELSTGTTSGLFGCFLLMKNYPRLVGSGVRGFEMEIPETKKPEPQGGIPWSVTWDPLGFDWRPEREVLVDYSWFFDGLWVNIPFGVFLIRHGNGINRFFWNGASIPFTLLGLLTEDQRVLIRIPKPKSIKSSLG